MQADITFADGIVTYAFTDSRIVAGSVSVKMSTCGHSNYDFGTFNAAVLKMGIIDDDAENRDFSGGTVVLSDGNTALGTYYIDPKTVKRCRKSVTFSAYDAAVRFDVELPDNVRQTSYTALTAIQAACTACGVTLSGSLPVGSPNTTVTFTFGNAAVQTWRDVVMWACQLICANAIINRTGQLVIRKAWYTYDDTPDFTCTAADRQDIEFSDTRVYIKYLTAHSGKNVKTYTTSRVAPSQSVAGELTLTKNPLLDDKSEADCDAINSALLAQPILSRQITAKMFSDATISLGDLGMFSGGKIDVRRSVRGMVTEIEWKYHGYTRVTCTAPDMAGGT